jgi:hypothetical protein
VHAVHDRWLREIVEDLNLCPFARRSRELGRVHRPVFLGDGAAPTAGDAADALARVIARSEDPEIVLLTFVLGREDPRQNPDVFEDFTRAIREHWEASPRPRWFMVAFHPGLAPDPTRAPTPQSLVLELRRTPDPVIQCVRSEVLDEVRRHARLQARARLMRDAAAQGPEIAALLAASVQTDCELSGDIARHNFDAVAAGAGRERFLERLDAIAQERMRRYPAAGG